MHNEGNYKQGEKTAFRMGKIIANKATEKELILMYMQYIYTMEYYSAIKKKAFESVLMRWMKLKPIIQ